MNTERDIPQPERRTFLDRRVITGLATVALVGILSACAAEQASPHLPERNHPAQSAPYFVDSSLPYYANLETAKSYVSDKESSERLESLINEPVGIWLYHDGKEAATTVQAAIKGAKHDKAVPLFVAYNIPNRDLGSHSAGGEDSARNYKEWITGISKAIGTAPATMVLEPDAVPGITHMEAGDAAERIELLGYALDTLQQNTHTSVYLDAGNSSWLSPEEAAGLMKKIDHASRTGITGISLNVSNFQSQADTTAYAKKIEDAYGQKLYVLIDNSRNGASVDTSGDNWCNPAGQKLGASNTVFDPSRQIETAYVKIPGESDGDCGISSKPAGEFDGKLLIEQLG